MPFYIIFSRTYAVLHYILAYLCRFTLYSRVLMSFYIIFSRTYAVLRYTLTFLRRFSLWSSAFICFYFILFSKYIHMTYISPRLQSFVLCFSILILFFPSCFFLPCFLPPYPLTKRRFKLQKGDLNPFMLSLSIKFLEIYPKKEDAD